MADLLVKIYYKNSYRPRKWERVFPNTLYTNRGLGLTYPKNKLPFAKYVIVWKKKGEICPHIAVEAFGILSPFTLKRSESEIAAPRKREERDKLSYEENLPPPLSIHRVQIGQ